MSIIINNIKWIMLIVGVLTCSMIFATIAPEAALTQSFGVTTSDPLSLMIVRSWGALITLIGIMLIYGAFKPIHRTFILTITSISKATFVTLVLITGQQYLAKAAITIIFDSLVVIIFISYLIHIYQQNKNKFTEKLK